MSEPLVIAPGSPERQETPSDSLVSHTSNGTPVCFLCRRKPAVKLPISGRLGNIVVFCSMQCAAISGVDHVLESEIVLCSFCNCWSDFNGHCPRCGVTFGGLGSDESEPYILSLQAGKGGVS